MSGNKGTDQLYTELYEENNKEQRHCITYTRGEQVSDKYRSVEITNFFNGSLMFQDREIGSCLVITDYNVETFRNLWDLTNNNDGFMNLLYYDPDCNSVITGDVVQGSLKNYLERNRSSMITNQDGKIGLTNNAKILIRDACKIVYSLHGKKIYGVVKSNNFFILENKLEAYGKPTIKLLLDDIRHGEHHSAQDYIGIREVLDVLYDGDFSTSTQDVQDFCQTLENTAEPYQMVWAHFLFYGPADKQTYLQSALRCNLSELEKYKWNWSSKNNRDAALKAALDNDPEKYSYSLNWNRDLVRFVRNRVKHTEGFEFFKLIEKNFPSFWKDLFTVTKYFRFEGKIGWESSLTRQQRSGGAGPSRRRRR